MESTDPIDWKKGIGIISSYLYVTNFRDSCSTWFTRIKTSFSSTASVLSLVSSTLLLVSIYILCEQSNHDLPPNWESKN